MNGVRQILLFNWPKFVLCVVLAGIALVLPFPQPWRLFVHGAALVGLGWVALGVLLGWLVYDVSRLYDWSWIFVVLPYSPRRYAVLSTGLDEISGRLAELLPGSEATLFDLYDSTNKDGSIRRARKLVTPPDGMRRAVPAHLPVADGCFDAVFVVFAAHELRDPGDRRALFGEIARTLRPGGRLVLVEHCRDAANILAYGPGAWHFYPRSEWLRLAAGARLTLVAEGAMTPLVRVMGYLR
jgi:SAM-dependent methyltransferase